MKGKESAVFYISPKPNKAKQTPFFSTTPKNHENQD